MQPHGRNASYIVGLTGGIGSGKSTISEIFRELGADIIDADEIAHNIVEKGTPLLKEIADHFGTQVLDVEGNLNRGAMRQLVFNDPTARQWLESLLHPVIQEEIKTRIHQSNCTYVLLVVPLLLETGNYDFVDRVLVVDIPESEQMARINQRDGTAAALIQQIMNSQASRQERLEQADDILDNSGNLEETREQVRRLHELYRQAASAAH